jgi:hypothetical protein
MKNRKIVNLAIIVLLTATFIACSEDDNSPSNDDNNNNTAAEIQQTSNLMMSGDWVITNFNDSGQNETSDFNGYVFSFNSDGSLVATNGNTEVSGTWSIVDDSSNDDSNDNDDIDFNIFFSSPDEFSELSEDWDIVSKSDTRIELIHISGGNGGTDLLTFEKS